MEFNFTDILSIPRWDVRTLAFRFMNHGKNELIDWLMTICWRDWFSYGVKEASLKGKVVAHYEKSFFKDDATKPLYGIQSVVLWWQNWWSCDCVGSGDKIKFIWIFDPMWLVNLSESDNDVLFHYLIRWVYKKDNELALQFQQVVRVCQAFGIHSCAD